MNSFLPDSHLNRLGFLQNLKTQIIADAAVLKWDAAKLVLVNAVLDPLIASYQTLVDAEAAASQALHDADGVFNARKEGLFGLVNELKADPDVTPGMADAMHLYASNPARGPATIKPAITRLVSEPGHVRLFGRKDYAELFNVYLRPVGTMAWVKVGANRKKFPFDDQTPLPAGATSQAREYYLRGVINDEEIGEPSDIAPVTFNG